jgi:hypothetical protein
MGWKLEGHGGRVIRDTLNEFTMSFSPFSKILMEHQSKPDVSIFGFYHSSCILQRVQLLNFSPSCSRRTLQALEISSKAKLFDQNLLIWNCNILARLYVCGL